MIWQQQQKVVATCELILQGNPDFTAGDALEILKSLGEKKEF